MKSYFRCVSCFLLIVISLNYGLGEVLDGGQARTPPRGWNSYDSFDWLITEEEFLENAKIVASNLSQFGYEYVTLDFLWYRSKGTGKDSIDEWGRLQPDLERWPSSAGGQGLSVVADKVHNLGLKFGIHVMRGVNMAAVYENTPILNLKGARARDIAMLNDSCSWQKSSFVGVNTDLEAGRAFLRSLYEQYAAWGVDAVKHDCVFGNDLEVGEVATVSEILSSLSRPILYSLSPGVNAKPDMAKQIAPLVNYYRVTSDTWDTWESLQRHFDAARIFFSSSELVGAPGLRGLSWPDLDMLPLGKLTDPNSGLGPYRLCRLSHAEQRTLVTLWAVAKSPLICGGDLRSIDEWTLSLLTNKRVLYMNAASKHNTEVQMDSSKRIWVSRLDAPDSENFKVYVALFNLKNRASTISITLSALLEAVGIGNCPYFWRCKLTNMWEDHNLQQTVVREIHAVVPGHDTFLASVEKCTCVRKLASSGKDHAKIFYLWTTPVYTILAWMGIN